jgi:uncharacterized membrane protein YdfJ with MMPL/SSD domain
MFKRVIYEDWATIVPIISFIATAAVFIIATVRALCLPKARCRELADIPLDDSTPRR